MGVRDNRCRRRKRVRNHVFCPIDVIWRHLCSGNPHLNTDSTFCPHPCMHEAMQFVWLVVTLAPFWFSACSTRSPKHENSQLQLPSAYRPILTNGSILADMDIAGRIKESGGLPQSNYATLYKRNDEETRTKLYRKLLDDDSRNDSHSRFGSDLGARRDYSQPSGLDSVIAP